MVTIREANSKLLDYVPEWQSVRPEAGSRRASFEAPVREEAGEIERAAEFLEAVDEHRVPEYIGHLVHSALQRRPADAPAQTPTPEAIEHLRAVLTRLSAQAARAIGPSAAARGNGSQNAERMAEVFGLESEGLSPEDRELELARQLVRFVLSAAGNLRRTSGAAGPGQGVRAALRLAAQKNAPGWLPLFESPGPRAARASQFITNGV